MNYTYKAILNGKVYDFPSLAYGFNNALQNVSSINEDEVMIDLDRFKKEAKYEDLKKLAGQCTDSIGMITTETYTKDDEEDFKELNSLGPTIRGFDDRARLFFENGEELLIFNKNHVFR